MKQWVLRYIAGCMAIALSGCASVELQPRERLVSPSVGRVYPPDRPLLDIPQPPGRVPYQALIILNVTACELALYLWNGVNWEGNVTLRTVCPLPFELPQEVVVGEVVRIGPAFNPTLLVVTQVDSWRRWQVLGIDTPVSSLTDRRTVYLTRRHLQILFNRLRGFRSGVRPGEVVVVLLARTP